jgi:muconolactone D-isomerase
VRQSLADIGGPEKSENKESVMLFHVRIDVRIPPNMDPKHLKQLGEQEHERAKELQMNGKWVHLWRIAGKYANISIFDVESPAELHDLLNSLPLYPFMDVEVAALCHHPGSLEINK